MYIFIDFLGEPLLDFILVLLARQETEQTGTCRRKEGDAIPSGTITTVRLEHVVLF